MLAALLLIGGCALVGIVGNYLLDKIEGRR
jgi:hypothetical protein